MLHSLNQWGKVSASGDGRRLIVVELLHGTFAWLTKGPITPGGR